MSVQTISFDLLNEVGDTQRQSMSLFLKYVSYQCLLQLNTKSYNFGTHRLGKETCLERGASWEK